MLWIHSPFFAGLESGLLLQSKGIGVLFDFVAAAGRYSLRLRLRPAGDLVVDVDSVGVGSKVMG